MSVCEGSTMRSVIQRVADLARQVFSPLAHRVPPTPELLDQLVRQANQITANDFNFDQNLIANSETYDPTDGRAPVTYMHIYEDHVFNMGVFVLRKGYAMPLHDHPGMYGICKVIHGKLGITSYSRCGQRPVPDSLKLLRFVRPTIAERQMVLDENSCCCLSPTDGNFHELRAVDGPAAFLDILAPPYDERASRRCHYYEEVLREDGVTWLRMIAQPRHYWCDQASYNGPSIDS